MNDSDQFNKECNEEIINQGLDDELAKLTKKWIVESAKHKYSYHFTWLGCPIIQFPQDMFGVQQLLWKIQPDLVIETGIARGGSLIFYASILELISLCGGNKDAKILGIDDKTGSIEVGKDANIVVSTGDLLDMSTNNVVLAFITGRNISLDNKHKQLYRRFEAKYEHLYTK